MGPGLLCCHSHMGLLPRPEPDAPLYPCLNFQVGWFYRCKKRAVTDPALSFILTAEVTHPFGGAGGGSGEARKER